jgi:hypothetical protein
VKIAANKKYIIRFVRSNPPYRPGDVAGFEKQRAEDFVAAKIATWDLDGALPQEVEVPVEPMKVEPRAAEPSDVIVDIPEDWESMHHLKLITLAKEISGGAVLSKAEAKEIIQEEVERRAAEAQA